MPTAKEHDDRDVAFIYHNQRMLAAMAWKGYQKHGRGILIVDETEKVYAPGLPPEQDTPVTYVPQQLISQHQGPWVEVIESIVKTYNPQTAIVLVIMRPDDKTGMYYAIQEQRTVPPPPQAFTEIGNALPERWPF